MTGVQTCALPIFLSPEQQQKIKDNLPEATLAAGGLLLTQRNLAKLMLDPQGAKALKWAATAKDKLTSPTAFTKLVVEPMYKILSTPFSYESPSFQNKSEYDISNIPVK